MSKINEVIEKKADDEFVSNNFTTEANLIETEKNESPKKDTIEISLENERKPGNNNTIKEMDEDDDEDDEDDDEEEVIEEEREEKLSRFAEIKNEISLGIIICFAQIPESVAFAYLANVEPSVALHSGWIIGLICGIFGGRPGMVNGTTGAFAAMISQYVKAPTTKKSGEGVEILFVSILVAGVFVILAGIFKLTRFIFFLKITRFISLVPSTVRIGFCNGLAIVIGSLIIMECFPKIPHKCAKIIPSSLLAIAFAVIVEFGILRPSGFKTSTIGDVSPFSSDTAFPIPFFVDSRYDLSKISSDSAGKIVWQGFMLGILALIETLMTMEMVNDFTKTEGNRERQTFTMGGANLVSGFMGGMGGNAMLGLSIINCINGGKTRIAPVVTSLGVMIMVMGGYPILNYIPIASLAGIMIVVFIHTFKWFSLKMIISAFMPKKLRDKFKLSHKIDRADVFIILLVTVGTIATNLVYAVFLGILVSSLMYSYNSGKLMKVVTHMIDHKYPSGKTSQIKVYEVDGPLFFASKMKFMKLFNPKEDPKNIQLHFPENTTFDYTAIETLNSIAKDYHSYNKSLHVKKLHEENEKLIEKSSKLLRNIKFVAGRDLAMPVIPQTYNKLERRKTLFEDPRKLQSKSYSSKFSRKDSFNPAGLVKKRTMGVRKEEAAPKQEVQMEDKEKI